MTDAYERVEHFAETHQCDFRLACYGVALERLARAYVDREIFP
jgi:glutamate dehydrogenase/leucine dehydrogenase